MPQVSLVFHSYDVVASPADDAETVIAILPNVDTIWPAAPINLHGWVTLQPDAAATEVDIRIRRGSLSGDIVGQGGAVFGGGAGSEALVTVPVDCVDRPGAVAGATYVLTVAAVDATGPSSVSAVHLSAQV